MKSQEFADELRALLNRYSKENGAHVPGFILANYLESCLYAFEEATRDRDKWYGYTPWEHIARPGAGPGPKP